MMELSRSPTGPISVLGHSKASHSHVDISHREVESVLLLVGTGVCCTALMQHVVARHGP